MSGREWFYLIIAVDEVFNNIIPMGSAQTKLDYELEDLARMSLERRKPVFYYWLDSTHTYGEVLTQLKKSFKIEAIPTVQQLVKELIFFSHEQIIKVVVAQNISQEECDILISQPVVCEIVCFRHNQNIATDSKKVVGHCSETKQLNKLLCEREKDVGKLSLISILSLQQDTRQANLSVLTLDWLKSEVKEKKSAKANFISLARMLYPNEEELINKFNADYDGSVKETLEWAFKDCFFWRLINRLPSITNDLKKLAYLRLPIHDLYFAIRSQFVKNQFYQDVYLIVEVSESEREKLLSKGYIVFPSFTKGFIDKKTAQKQCSAKPNTMIVEVKGNRLNLDERTNFGYYFNEKSREVIFNVNLFFHVESVDNRKVRVMYGGLSEVQMKKKNIQALRQTSQTSRIGLTAEQSALLRNSSYLQDLRAAFYDQTSLLQLGGNCKEALYILEREQPSSHLFFQRGEAFRRDGDYDHALQAYNQVKEPLRASALLRKAAIYIAEDRTAQLDQTLTQLQPFLPQMEASKSIDFLWAENYAAVLLIKQERYQKAKDLLLGLKKQVQNTFAAEGEGKPISHEVRKNLATCYSCLKNHTAALQLLTSTFAWQKECEGNTANLALTETLIINVSRDKGDIKQTEMEMLRLSQIEKLIQDPTEKKILSRSLLRLSSSGNSKGLTTRKTEANQTVNPTVLQVPTPVKDIVQSQISVKL